MSEELFSTRTLVTFLMFLLVSYSASKVADFYGVDPDVYATYLYFYVILYIAYLILPSKIPQL
jgi:hypothetical protein